LPSIIDSPTLCPSNHVVPLSSIGPSSIVSGSFSIAIFISDIASS